MFDPHPIDPELPTTSSSQPPGRKARRLLQLYANLFGVGVFVLFAAAAWAMLVRLGDASQTTFWGPPWEVQPWHLIALLLGSLPYALAFGVSLLYRWSAFSRYDFILKSQERSPNTQLLNTQDWSALVKRAKDAWIYETRRFSENRSMASLHALIFGLVASLTLFICTTIVAPSLISHPTDAGASQLELVAIAVGTATALAFVSDLGRIVFRVALRDAGAEIFSFATKNLILVVVSALLFGTLLSSGLEQLDSRSEIPLGFAGFIVIGAAIAVLGDRAVRFVSDRAATVIGVTPPRAEVVSDLTQIEGIRDEDIARLIEAGVDSLHSLAFIPLPRLFFNTKYSLERLCDWQDQALLLTHVGQAKAKLLHEHLLVRGAIAAQDAALALFPEAPAASQEPSPAGQVADPNKLSSMLGFADREYARFALNKLASDEQVNRLRVYATAGYQLRWAELPPGEDPRLGDPSAAGEPRQAPAGAPAGPAALPAYPAAQANRAAA